MNGIGRRFVASFVAGSVAIGLNTLALKAADLISLPTARGGLLRLISLWFDPAPAWQGLSGLPGFQIGFHLFVGLMMAICYGVFLEPLLPGGATRKGLIYAATVWLLNAAVVLPATGEGFAGSAHLTLAGMLWFAVAHTGFFLLLAWGFAWMVAPRKPASAQERFGSV